VESFITWKASWRWGFWVYTILSILGLVMILLIGDETWYDRSRAGEKIPAKRSRLLRLVGVEQWRPMRSAGLTFSHAVSRPFVAIFKIPVALSVLYYFINFAWVIGVNATTSVWLTTLYGFNGKSLGKSSPIFPPFPNNPLIRNS
jgi:hypothetical protein